LTIEGALNHNDVGGTWSEGRENFGFAAAILKVKPGFPYQSCKYSATTEIGKQWIALFETLKSGKDIESSLG